MQSDLIDNNTLIKGLRKLDIPATSDLYCMRSTRNCATRYTQTRGYDCDCVEIYNLAKDAPGYRHPILIVIDDGGRIIYWQPSPNANCYHKLKHDQAKKELHRSL